MTKLFSLATKIGSRSLKSPVAPPRKLVFLFPLLFHSLTGRAQALGDLCQMSLRDASITRFEGSMPEALTPKLVDNPALSRLFENQHESLKNTEYQFFDILLPEEQLQKAKLALQNNHVEYSEAQDKKNLGPVRNTKLIIVPDSHGSLLNQLANSLQRKMGVLLTYNPRQLGDGSTAYFLSTMNEIGIPHKVVLTGQPNISLFHEIRHGSMANKLRKGKPSIFEGTVVMTDPNIPTNHPYDQYLSFQETATYYQDAKFAYHASLSPKVLQLSLGDQRRLFNRVLDSLRHSRGILDFVGRRLDHATKIIVGGGGKIEVSRRRDRPLSLSLSDHTYEFNFVLGAMEPPAVGTERDLLLGHIQKIIQDQQFKQKKLEDMKVEVSKRLSVVNRQMWEEKTVP